MTPWRTELPGPVKHHMQERFAGKETFSSTTTLPLLALWVLHGEASSALNETINYKVTDKAFKRPFIKHKTEPRENTRPKPKNMKKRG